MATESMLPTSIEQLPTEILLQIFAFFNLQELITTFFGLNSHINSIVRSVRNASHIVPNNDSDAVKLLQQFPQQIARLIITNTDMVDFTSLSNLRSITLKYISSAQLKSIRSQYFPLLEILHIYTWPRNLSLENAIEVDDLFRMIFNNEFPRLRLCTAVGVAPLLASKKWSTSPSLRFLYVNMKTANDYEQLLYTCPNLRWFPSYENAWVDPVYQFCDSVNKRAAKRIWKDLNELNQLELEGKFIQEVNPFIVFNCKKRQSRSSEMKKIMDAQHKSSPGVCGRIFLQAEPYCRTPFLIEIKLPNEYPFKIPEITFLDPIHHPNIDANGKLRFQFRLHIWKQWNPNYNLVNSIRDMIDIIDQVFSMPSTENEMPPKDVAEKLLQYLDILYPNGVSINPVINIEQNRYPEYKSEVNMFFEIVDRYAQDYEYDPSIIYSMVCNPDKIASANWTEIKQMLSCILGATKFSGDAIGHAIESDHVKWILLRLKKLVE